MSSYLYSLHGWVNGGDTAFERFNNDTQVWSGNLGTTPFNGDVVSANTGFRQQGGWDGQKWYVIGNDGKLYAWNGSTWSAALAAGAVIISGTVEDQNWVMTSDGRFIYILAPANGFRRYDPTSDTLTLLSAPPGGTYSGKLWLVYDGNDTIYGYKGANDAQIGAYSISGGSWTSIATQATMVSDSGGAITFAAFLQGKLYAGYMTGGTVKVFEYDPTGPTWTAKATTATQPANPDLSSPYGEETDGSIRLWGSGGNSRVYTIGLNSYSDAAALTFTRRQGMNWAVSRTFEGEYLWFESDQTTPLDTIEELGSLVAGDVLVFHATVQSQEAHAAGVTVSVPNMPTTDAEDVVTISATGSGYGTSFSTGALLANAFFDVYIRVAPTISQTLGLDKIFNIRIIAN